MKMSEEMALKLHRMMWSDMQKELGDTPDRSARHKFKEKWCETHFPGEHIRFNCFLCDYCGHDCDRCPIEWPDNTCSSAFGQPPIKTDYRFAPISEILALPTRNQEIVVDDLTVKDEETSDRNSAYLTVKKKLAEASGFEFYYPVEDHISAIKQKAAAESAEKAVDEYFAKMPLAKAITTDVDEAFKQYANEQKAPIFKELAEASGLEELCHNVSEHISAIKKKSALKQWNTDINTLKSTSGLSYATIAGFGNALKQKLEDCSTSVSLLNKYKNRLSSVSGQDRDKPIDIHLDSIYDRGFTFGKKQAKKEMLKKIEEVLKS